MRHQDRTERDGSVEHPRRRLRVGQDEAKVGGGSQPQAEQYLPRTDQPQRHAGGQVEQQRRAHDGHEERRMDRHRQTDRIVRQRRPGHQHGSGDGEDNRGGVEVEGGLVRRPHPATSGGDVGPDRADAKAEEGQDVESRVCRPHQAAEAQHLGDGPHRDREADPGADPPLALRARGNDTLPRQHTGTDGGEGANELATGLTGRQQSGDHGEQRGAGSDRRRQRATRMSRARERALAERHRLRMHSRLVCGSRRLRAVIRQGHGPIVPALAVEPGSLA